MENLSQLLYTLVIVALVIGGVVLAAVLAAGITKLIVFVKYNIYNDNKSATDKTAGEVAREYLDANGLQEVKVEKLGFFRALFYGNHYNMFKKIVYLRKGIINSNSITAVSVALQKVGLALQHKEGKKSFKVRSVLGQCAVFGPLLFLPIAAIGVIIDFFAFNMSGIVSIVGVALGFVFYLLATIFTFLNVKIEKIANQKAYEMIENGGLVSAEELSKVKGLFNSFIAMYVCNAILAFMKLFYYFLKLISIVFKGLAKSK